MTTTTDVCARQGCPQPVRGSDQYCSPACKKRVALQQESRSGLLPHDELTVYIRARYAWDLATVHQGLFSEDSDVATALERAGSDQAAVRRAMDAMPKIAGVRSLIERHAHLTIMATLAPESAVFPTSTRPGQVLTVSTAAHHSTLNMRLPVDLDEATAWARAITGPSWEAGLYDAGTLTGTARPGTPNPRRLTHYFRAFITPHGTLQDPPTDTEGPLRKVFDAAAAREPGPAR